MPSYDPMEDLKFFRSKSVNWIIDYLRKRGITVDVRRKEALVQLCLFASSAGLYVSGASEQVLEADHKHRLLVGARYLPEPETLEWSADLSGVPVISMTDVFIYLREKCGWTSHRLRQYKEDDGAKLNQAGHVHNVMVFIHLYPTPFSCSFYNGLSQK